MKKISEIENLKNITPNNQNLYSNSNSNYNTNIIHITNSNINTINNNHIAGSNINSTTNIINIIYKKSNQN